MEDMDGVRVADMAKGCRCGWEIGAHGIFFEMRGFGGSA